MAHQVPWSKDLIDKFIDRAMLSEEEAFIMRSRVQNWTVSMQADHLGKSESAVHSMIRKLKIKYDIVQAESPDIFPERKFSAKEVYMDSH